MLTVIISGTSDERLAARRAAAGDAAVQEFDAASVPVDELATIASTPALFGGAQAFLIRNALGGTKNDNAEEEVQEPRAKSQDLKTSLLDIAPGLVESPHTFIFEEEKLLASVVAKLRTAGAMVESFEKAVAAKPEFNVFSLADAMARGDKKTLWLLLMRALRQGVAPENVAGILAWKARTMLASARSAEERTRYGALSRGLVVMYHDSHRGAGDLSLLLEKFALEM